MVDAIFTDFMNEGIKVLSLERSIHICEYPGIQEGSYEIDVVTDAQRLSVADSFSREGLVYLTKPVHKLTSSWEYRILVDTGELTKLTSAVWENDEDQIRRYAEEIYNEALDLVYGLN